MDYFIVVLLFLVLGLLRVAWKLNGSPKSPFPVMKRRWYHPLMLSNPVWELTAQGYNACIKLSGKPFIVRYWEQDYLVLPPTREHLRDVRRAHIDHLSFLHSVSRTFLLYKWVMDLFTSDRMAYVVKKGLNPHLPTLTNTMIDEADYAFNAIFRDLTESKTFPALTTLSKLTLRTVARIMVGEELCRNDKFLNAAQSYFDGNFLIGVVALKLPFGPLRDIIAWPLYKLHQHQMTKAIRFISPAVQRRMEQGDIQNSNPSKSDAITHTLKLLKEFPINTSGNGTPVLWRLSSEVLQNLWASGSSPGLLLTQMVFQLLEQPAYLDPLREEAEAAIAKHGWNEGLVNDLPLQDSFMRECNRLYPSFSLQCTRTVTGKPFEFSSGLIVPPGTKIAFPAEASQLDPDHIANPLEFDGYRFIKLTESDARMEEGVNKWAASHAGRTNLAFGYGNHVCPGRFIAVRLLKVIFTKLILEYDITWDFTGPGQPPRFRVEGLSTPHTTQTIHLEKRERKPHVSC